MTHSRNKSPKRVAAGKRANRKGKVGQTEAKNYLTKLGFDGVNSASHGVTGGVDVYARDLPNVAIEVKYHYASMDIHTACLRKAWEQARGPMDVERFRREAESGQSCTPVVLWRPLRKPWRLTWMEPCGLVTTTGDDAIKSQLLRLNGGKDK